MEKHLKDKMIIGLGILFLFGLGISGVLRPNQEMSAAERRRLATFPQITKKSILDGSFMQSFETYGMDQFPFREQFRSLKSVVSYKVMRKMDHHDIYIEKGYAAQLEPVMDEESVAYAAKRFRFVYDTYLKDTEAKVYLSIIPDKNYFLAKEGNYPSMDYDEFRKLLVDNMEYADYIDIFSSLQVEDYYRTDTHWRQEQILDVAQVIAKGMDTPLRQTYKKQKLSVPFYGVYYGQSALPMKAEELCYMECKDLETCKVFDYETQSEGVMYDLERANGLDGYEIYLSGPKSLLTIENKNATTNKELIVFRDSFGSSIAPFFTEGYQKITLVDIRYLSPHLVGRFVDFTNQDVLFLYSTSVLNHSNTIK